MASVNKLRMINLLIVGLFYVLNIVLADIKEDDLPVGIRPQTVDGFPDRQDGIKTHLMGQDGVSWEYSQVIITMDDACISVGTHQHLPGKDGIGGAQRQTVSLDMAHVGGGVVHVEDGVALQTAHITGVVHHQHTSVDRRHILG